MSRSCCFFSCISDSLNPRITLEGKELGAYRFLKSLADNSEKFVLALFNTNSIKEKEIADEIYLKGKSFTRAVSEALFVYLHDHGALFNFTAGKKFAEANAHVESCQHALNIIKTILDRSNSEDVAISSRLYRLVNQFANKVNETSDTRLYEVLEKLLLEKSINTEKQSVIKTCLI